MKDVDVNSRTAAPGLGAAARGYLVKQTDGAHVLQMRVQGFPREG